MATTTIRPARREDCAAMVAIYNHYVAHDTCTYATEPEAVEARQAWFDQHGPAHPVLVAEAEGQVVGWASLSPYNLRAGYRMTVEDSIYLQPGWRGQGLGGALLRRLVDSARASGHHAIVACISAEQEASVALHRRLGFEDAGRLREVGHKFGRWLDVVNMQLTLPRPEAAVTIALESPRQPEVVALIEALDVYLTARYPSPSIHRLDVEELSARQMRFFVARRGGEALGCAALRFDNDGYGEVKRMFVLPRARGLKVGRQLLRRLEAEACAQRLPVLRLETGVHQPEALGLYRAFGFVERGPFGDYPADPLSVFMEKSLTTG
jgi:L-amino acid N-acyltransferase YncA